jgi:hypothetical protein
MNRGCLIGMIVMINMMIVDICNAYVDIYNACPDHSYKYN